MASSYDRAQMSIEFLKFFGSSNRLALLDSSANRKITSMIGGIIAGTLQLLPNALV